MSTDPHSLAAERAPLERARFSSKLDILLGLAAEGLLMAGAVAAALALRGRFSMSLFASLLAFGITLFFETLLMMWFIRSVAPMRGGVFAPGSSTRIAWNLIGFLDTNLGWCGQGGLMPVPLRKLYYRARGCSIGAGLVIIGGRLGDPYLVTIGREAMIGDGALVIGHALTANDTLVLGRVRIGQGAVVGARSLVMPGVEVGAGAMINAGSVVAMNTHIGAGEVWSGNPARCVRTSGGEVVEAI
ncbi:MAG: hypothetical protein JRH20_00420 [Deltaproteobacteria bacterium]|nr:hypothetical protein [Deltaproteobacteria bacterium]